MAVLPHPSTMPSVGVQVRVWLDTPLAFHCDPDILEDAVTRVILDKNWRARVMTSHNIPEALAHAIAVSTCPTTQLELFPNKTDGPICVTPIVARHASAEAGSYVQLGSTIVHVYTLSAAVLVVLTDAMRNSSMAAVEAVYKRLSDVLNGYAFHETAEDVLRDACEFSRAPMTMLSNIKTICVRGYGTSDDFIKVLDAMRFLGNANNLLCAHSEVDTRMVPSVLPFTMPNTALWSSAAEAMTSESDSEGSAWACSLVNMLEAVDPQVMDSLFHVGDSYVRTVVVPLLVTYARGCAGPMRRESLLAILKSPSPVWSVASVAAATKLDRWSQSSKLSDVLASMVRSTACPSAIDVAFVLDAMYVPCNEPPSCVDAPCWSRGAPKAVIATPGVDIGIHGICFSVEHWFKSGVRDTRVQRHLAGMPVQTVDVGALPLPPCRNAMSCVALAHPIRKLVGVEQNL